MFGVYFRVFSGLGTFWSIVEFMELRMKKKTVAEKMKRKQS